MNKRTAVVVVLLLGISALGVGYGIYAYSNYQANQLFEKSKAALEEGQYLEARVFSEKSLALKRNHYPALLVFAESIFKDQSVEGAKRVKIALEALEEIPDTVEEGLIARTHEASIYFFDRLEPTRAEKSLKKAIAMFPDHAESYQSLMRIYCCTSRESLVEPLFEQMIELASGRKETFSVLKSWFLSQFATETFNSGTDRLLRVEGLYQTNISSSAKRILAFRDADPDDQMPKVALAYWFYLRLDGKQAKLILDELDPEKLDPSDPLYLTTAINVYLENGEIELASELHTYWKGQQYFEYWRQKGVVEQDYRNEPKQAFQSFEKALSIWPGPIDPSIYFRLETCLKSLGDPVNALKYRRLGEEIRDAVGTDRIKELQALLLKSELSKENCDKFVSFYETLGRPLEATHWHRLSSLSN
ncbi:MAG: hypothetical protein VX438_10765 [Planctomycetota bacterium]|nr:hypothetical protein [Planctomycetota bacterium]